MRIELFLRSLFYYVKKTEGTEGSAEGSGTQGSAIEGAWPRQVRPRVWAD